MSLDKKPAHPMIGHSHTGIPFKVVVVDDEFAHRRIMTQLLKSVGFDVCAEGTNGEDAQALVRQHKPDFLLMDFHMPRLDGLQASKAILEELPALKIVMFTTENEKAKVLEVLKVGVKDYIIKPIDRHLVIEKLTHLVKA